MVTRPVEMGEVRKQRVDLLLQRERVDARIGGGDRRAEILGAAAVHLLARGNGAAADIAREGEQRSCERAAAERRMA